MSQWRLLHTLDVNFLRDVARNRKLLHSFSKSYEMVACLDCRISQRYSALRGNSCERCRKLTFAGEKLRVSAVQSSITCLLSIAALAIHLPYSNSEMNGIHPLGEKNILPSQKAKRKSGQSEKKSDQVAFLSGEMVPVSGIWRPDHTRCPSVGDVWLRKQTPFPPCPGCGLSAGFGLIEEVLHISEDPDFQ
jgi:hypothetical protein